MTPDERERMNRICAEIQEERDYTKFTGLLRQMNELIERKVERRFRQYPRVWCHGARPSVTVPAVAQKIIKPLSDSDRKERVEISIAGADALFREVRIENRFTDMDGQSVALKQGARLDVTFEADAVDTTRDLA